MLVKGFEGLYNLNCTNVDICVYLSAFNLVWTVRDDHVMVAQTVSKSQPI